MRCRLAPPVCSHAVSHLHAIDLFAGAGGLGIGSEMAGADLRLSIDSDPWSCETLRSNQRVSRRHIVLEADVKRLSGEFLRQEAGLSWDDGLIIVGGAPCQPFSKAAYWTDEGKDAAYRRARARGTRIEKPPPPSFIKPDPRRTLVEEYWRLVEEADADGFIFENVRSITHPRHRPVLDALLSAADRAGFATTVVKACAADFGIPQLRHRVFVIGSRWAQPVAPMVTHAPAARATERGLQPYATCGQTLAPFSGDRHFEPEEVIEGRWAKHLAEVPPGWNYKWHTAWAGHRQPTFVTETRFWNFLLKLSPDLPSWTVNASPGPWTGPFHWDSRRLRTPELAALQTFPRSYMFAGPRRERVRQIGNAVPCRLAEHVARAAIDACLSLADTKRQPEAA